MRVGENFEALDVAFVLTTLAEEDGRLSDLEQRALMQAANYIEANEDEFNEAFGIYDADLSELENI